MSILHLDHVTKQFGTGALAVRAVDDVTLDVSEGELVIVMGPSGSGKTTLLQLVGALLTPTQGTVSIRNRSLAGMTSRELAHLRRAEIGFMFQSFNLFAALTAQENVALPAHLVGVAHREATRRAAARLDQLGLGKRLHHLPDALSGGEKQRVAIARALINDPPLILADEPTANLDSASGYHVLHLLEGIAEQAGKTVVMVTHDHRITPIADRLLWLEDGRLRDREASFATAGDPVCGMEIVVERAAAQRTVEGRTYWFCSSLCVAKFDANPALYLPDETRPVVVAAAREVTP